MGTGKVTNEQPPKLGTQALNLVYQILFQGGRRGQNEAGTRDMCVREVNPSIVSRRQHEYPTESTKGPRKNRQDRRSGLSM